MHVQRLAIERRLVTFVVTGVHDDARSGSSVRLESGVLSAECQHIFREWQERPDRVVY